MLSLRGTQEEFVNKAVEVLQSKSSRKEIMVAPVAYGKSICIAGTVSRLDAPTIVLQPNKELLEQNYAKYTSYGYQASIFSASMNSKELGHVTYATIQSIKKYHQEVKALGVKYIIIDECHIGTARGSTIDKFIKDAGIKNVLGVTATPVILTTGGDGGMLKMMNRSFKNMFSNIHHVVQIKELVDAKYWSELIYDIRTDEMEGLEFNQAGTDYTKESIKIAYEINNTHQDVVQTVGELIDEGRKSILVFVPSIVEARELSKEVPNSAVVSSKTKKSERNQIINDFKSGKVRTVFNVQVLTAGFDHPQLDAIVLARPTASIALYYQMLGRGTRIHPKKANTKIVDLSGNTSNFGPIEHLNYEYIDGYGWGMFTGDELLTDIVQASGFKRPTKQSLRARLARKNMTEEQTAKTAKLWFGKHNDKMLKDIPKSYLAWIHKEFEFNGAKMLTLKKNIEIVLNIPA
jgi:DNA repair protein RadD